MTKPSALNGLSYIGYSEDGSTNWSSLGAYAGNIKVSGGDLKTGEFYSFEDAYPEIVAGQFEVTNVQVRLLYTEGTTEPYAKLRAHHDDRSDVYLRWSYGPGTTHYWRTKGPVVSCPLPDSDAASADPLAVEVIQRTAQIEEFGAS